MADDVHEVNGDSDEHLQNNEDPNQKKSAKHDSGAADLEKVTDYAEEKEIFSTDNNDEFKGAMSIIGDRRNKEVAEKMAKERELLKVAIKKEDVDVIMPEDARMSGETLQIKNNLRKKFDGVVGFSTQIQQPSILPREEPVSEFEIGRPKAERILREHHGDIVEALTALTN